MKTTLWALLALFSAAPFVSNAQSNTYPWPSTGAIGIGTASPTGKLDVENNANSSTVSYVRNTSSGTAASSQFIATDNSGNLQMGQTSASLAPNGLITASSGFVFSNGKSNGLRLFTVDNTNLTLGTNNSAAVTVSSGGNVGIGTTAPTNNLTVANTGESAIPTLGSNGGKIGILNGLNNDGYGLLMGVLNNGNAYQQVQRVDGTATAYNLLFQPNAGNVGIGTTSPDEKLSVYGKIHSQEVKVDLSVPGPDYVFAPTYKLPSLAEIKSFIDKNQHLPEIPTAIEMAKNGIDLGEMNTKLLKKVEELTLYLIKESATNKKQQQAIKKLQQQLNHLSGKRYKH